MNEKHCVVFAILAASLPTFPVRAEDARDAPEPKAGLVIASDDVLDSKARQMGGRMITIRRINPLDLPAAPDSVQPPDPLDPGVMERLRLLREKRRATRFVLIGATVYRSSSFTGGSRTKVTMRDPQSGQLITCWSSADFAHLAYSTEFTDDSATIRTLIMTHGTIDIDRWGEFRPPKSDSFFDRACFIRYDADPKVTAHEVGHALDLAFRAVGQGQSHDHGPWPKEFNTQQLPRSRRLLFDVVDEQCKFWIRREDWVRASNSAKNLK